MGTNWKWQLAQQLEIRWWKNYLKNKDVESYISWKKNYWQSFLQKIPHLPELNNLSILDAGCGPAGIFTILQNNQVDAIDPLIEQYKKLPHFQPEQYSNITFKTQSIEQLNEVEKYDLIFCLNAINHVENIDIAYDKLIHSLKPKGTIVVSIDAHRNALLHKIFKAIPGDVLHPHQFNLKEYEDFLTERKIQLLPSILIKKEFIFDYYITYGKK